MLAHYPRLCVAVRAAWGIEQNSLIQEFPWSSVANDPFSCLLCSITHSDVDLLKRKAKDIVDRKQIIEGF